MLDNDFKDLDEKEYKVSSKNLVIILITSILTVIFYNLNINNYIKDVIIPFMLLLVSYIVIFKEEKQNKKAYLMLIPIFLIFVSELIVGIDGVNKDLNILILPVLISMFLFLLLNKNFTITGNSFLWMFKLFPQGLFTNLKYFKLKTNSDNKGKAKNVFLGIVFGFMFGIVILYLLTQADDYFNAFLGNIFKGIFNFNPTSLFMFIITFILGFSVLINILKYKDSKMKKIKIRTFDNSLITTFLIFIDAIFVLFLFSELSRLTTNFLQIPIEYTYSSYAREGFFQLLGVTLINFSIIFYLLYKTKLSENKNIRILMTLLIVFSIVLIGNSYYRMYLYIDHFGFTVLRLQVILFLLMELILFVLLILRIYNCFKEKNAYYYFIIIITFYILNLYLCNDTFINLLN